MYKCSDGWLAACTVWHLLKFTWKITLLVDCVRPFNEKWVAYDNRKRDFLGTWLMCAFPRLTACNFFRAKHRRAYHVANLEDYQLTKTCLFKDQIYDRQSGNTLKWNKNSNEHIYPVDSTNIVWKQKGLHRPGKLSAKPVSSFIVANILSLIDNLIYSRASNWYLIWKINFPFVDQRFDLWIGVFFFYQAKNFIW